MDGKFVDNLFSFFLSFFPFYPFFFFFFLQISCKPSGSGTLTPILSLAICVYLMPSISVNDMVLSEIKCISIIILLCHLLLTGRGRGKCI